MLSKSSTLILGIIAEKPINPYEITKLLEFISVKNWFSVATSSIYATIRTLQEKEYIIGENIKEGNMPEKTIYSITSKGAEQLSNAIEEFLGNTDLDFVKFNIAVILICHITKESALGILNKKIIDLKSKKDTQKANLKMLSTTEPLMGLHTIKHMLYLTDTEIKSVEEFMRTVEVDSEWNHFLANDIKI